MHRTGILFLSLAAGSALLWLISGPLHGPLAGDKGYYMRPGDADWAGPYRVAGAILTPVLAAVGCALLFAQVMPKNCRSYFTRSWHVSVRVTRDAR